MGGELYEQPQKALAETASLSVHSTVVCLSVSVHVLPDSPLALYVVFDWGLSSTHAFIGLENYRWLLEDSLFWRVLRNNSVYAG